MSILAVLAVAGVVLLCALVVCIAAYAWGYVEGRREVRRR